MIFKWLASMKRFFNVLPSALFVIWTIGVMATYFFFYERYGLFYLDAIAFLLALASLLSAFFFLTAIPSFLMRKPHPLFILVKTIPNVIRVPLTFIIGGAVLAIIGWILLFLLLTRDAGIAGNNIFSTLIVIAITLASFSIGSSLLRKFRIETSGLIEHSILSTLLGFGVLMAITYLAGMTGLLYRSFAYTLIFGTLTLFRREWLKLFQDIKSTSLPWRIRPFFSFDNFALLASTLLSIFALTGLFSQFAAGWDEMHTYQAFPHAYAEAHRIVDFKYWFASGFPQNTEMLFTLAHLMNGFTPSAGLNTVFYFLLPGILILLKRLVFPKASSPIIILLFFLSAIPYLMITIDHKIDLAFWSYTLLATFFLLRFLNTPKRKTFLLFAILSGISAGTKYNFLSIILPSFLIVLLFFPKTFPLKKRLIHIGATLAIIAVCFSPWAVKNIIFSGNPVEPALGDLLSRDDTFFKQIGRSYSEHLREQFSDSKIWAEDQEMRDWKFYVSLPFRITLNFRGALTDIVNIGPMFLLTLPFILLFIGTFFAKSVPLQSKSIQFLSMIFFQLVSWTFLSNFFPWYTFSALLLTNIFIVQLLQAERRRFIRMSILTSIIALSLSTFFIRLDSIFRNPSLFTKDGGQDYSLRDIADFINQNNLKGLIWNCPGPSLHYYVHNSESRVVYDYYLLIFHSLKRGSAENKAFLKEKLSSLGISYFIFNEPEIEYLQRVSTSAENVSPQSSEIFRNSVYEYINFRDSSLTEIFRNGNIAIYTFKETVREKDKTSLHLTSMSQ